MKAFPHGKHLHPIPIPEDTEPSKLSSKGIEAPSSNSVRTGLLRADGTDSRRLLGADHKNHLGSKTSVNMLSKTSGNMFSASTLAQLTMRSKTQRTLLDSNTNKFSLLYLPPYSFEAKNPRKVEGYFEPKSFVDLEQNKTEPLFSSKRDEHTEDSECEPQPVPYELDCQGRDRVTYRLQSTKPQTKYMFMCSTGGKGVDVKINLHHCDGGLRATVSLTRDPKLEKVDASCATTAGKAVVEWNYDGTNRTKIFYCLLNFEIPSTFNVTFRFEVNQKIPFLRRVLSSRRPGPQSNQNDELRTDPRYYHDYLIADIERMESNLHEKLKQRRPSDLEVSTSTEARSGMNMALLLQEGYQLLLETRELLVHSEPTKNIGYKNRGLLARSALTVPE